MKYIMKEDDKMYIFSMGKKLRLTAIFDNEKECNDYCAKCNDGVIASFGNFVFCADCNDKGI